jgi:hypothetical protein
MQNLRVGEEFVQCEKFITMCSNLSKVSYCSPWEQFTFASSLLIMTKYLATVKEKKCDIIRKKFVSRELNYVNVVNLVDNFWSQIMQRQHGRRT